MFQFLSVCACEIFEKQRGYIAGPPLETLRVCNSFEPLKLSSDSSQRL